MNVSGRLRPIADDGSEVDATFELHATAVFQIIYHHKAGGWGTPKSVNSEYNKGLELLLSRLGALQLKIVSIEVDSTVAHQLDPADRRLALNYPILLGPNTDISELRLNISRAQKPIGRRANVKPGSDGNSQKRIRITVESDELSLAPQDLAGYLIEGPAARAADGTHDM